MSPGNSLQGPHNERGGDQVLPDAITHKAIGAQRQSAFSVSGVLKGLFIVCL